ncbi:hypothetical protein BEL04_06665 [Mucilaginibacter sp. PPCGB 2223]|nr:hypothetical protein BEL04_06665 [Mucilaginibacter sp. PPCGB 2223]
MIAGAITVAYFKNLHLPGQQSGRVMSAIPADAALVLEYKNDQDFYELLGKDSLLTTLIGDQRSAELIKLKTSILQNRDLKSFFAGQSIFISVHPRQDSVAFLITTSGNKPLNGAFERFGALRTDDIDMAGTNFAGRPGLVVNLHSISKKLYIVNQGENIFSASFSKQLAEASALYRTQKHGDVFVQMTDQQDANSIANLYVNYRALDPLFDGLFKSKNNDILRSFRQMPAVASLNLNYKSDALMFNGTSHINGAEPNSYLSLFRYQQPTVNELKDIFPLTTAYSVNFAVSDPVKFENNLFQWQVQNGVNVEKKAVFARIKRETAVDLMQQFMNDLGNEFAIITTKYQEKLAIVKLKNGLQLRPFMVNISTMVTEDAGQFNYDKLPLFLLGDAFSIFRRPYFIIADNYLIMCASQTGLLEYYRNYTNGNLLSHNDEYRRFDNLQAEKSNVSFFLQFKNSQQLLQNELEPNYAGAFEKKNTGWNKYYAASYQLTTAGKDFYTNFYMRLNVRDTSQVNP